MDDSAEPDSIKRRLLTSVVVILVAAFVGTQGFRHLAAMKKESARSDAGVLPPLVRAEKAVRADYTETLRGFGRAQPLRRAQVVAEVPGVVTALAPALEAGTAIVAQPETNGNGSPEAVLPVLVKLDDRDLVDRLERARLEVKAAESELVRLSTVKGSLRERLAVTDEEVVTAERELERIRPLVPKTLPRSDLDAQSLQVTLRQRAKLQLEAQIKENVEAAKGAELRQAALQRAVNLAERELSRAVVRAPFPGRIEERHVDIGERVRVGDPLFTIINLSRMQVPVALAAGEYDAVRIGADARVRLPEATEALWEGSVTRIAPQINVAERTFYAYLVVTGEDAQTAVPPGAHVVAEVEGRTHAAVVAVPRRAFLGERVFVAHVDKEATRKLAAEIAAVAAEKADDDAPAAPAPTVYVVSQRTPTVVRYLSGVALVATGIEDGELYLVTNLESVAEGSRVRLVIDEAR